MTTELTAQTESSRPGWASRIFRSLGARRSPANVRTPHGGGNGRGTHREPSASEVRGMTARLIADERYVFVLLGEASADIEDHEAAPAWDALRDRMALIPGGHVQVVMSNGSVASTDLPAFHLDRCAVTNQQFRRFVNAGAYDALEIWPREVWPSLMRFTDQTDQPGPRDWRRGDYPSGLADHPVVGITWHEAAAYARWVGKRLPTSAEWQKAAGWPEQIAGGACSRYPWGDIFDPARANLWATGLGRTAPVRSYPAGATRNGIHQLAGNVWEWLEDPLDTIPCRPDEAFQPWRPMRRIAGGAFNTYFAAEASCQFVTGQPELDRCDNIGFRCAVPSARLRPGP